MSKRAQSKFNIINEMNCKKFQTTALDRNDIDRIARITTHILIHFVDQNYQVYYNKGCVTFQDERNNQKVITLFVDYENHLAHKNQIPIHKNPVAVCIELTHLEPVVKKAMRDYLRTFSYYCDPENGYSKWALLPNTDHVFDVLFLQEGDCKLSLDEETYENISTKLNEAFEKNHDNFSLSKDKEY